MQLFLLLKTIFRFQFSPETNEISSIRIIFQNRTMIGGLVLKCLSYGLGLGKIMIKNNHLLTLIQLIIFIAYYFQSSCHKLVIKLGFPKLRGKMTQNGFGERSPQCKTIDKYFFPLTLFRGDL